MALNFKEKKMPNLSIRNQLLLGAFLILLLVITRSHNTLSFDLIPVSTIGLFFLLGVYFRKVWVLTLAFAVVWMMDITGMTWSGNTEFCLKDSYLFLLLSYSVYWASGRLFATLYAGENLTSLALLTLIAPTGAALGYLVSSASFHYWSGSLEEDIIQMFSDYSMRLTGHLEGLAVYLVIAVFAHMLFSTFAKRHSSAQTA
jgi:hypothetical protein